MPLNISHDTVILHLPIIPDYFEFIHNISRTGDRSILSITIELEPRRPEIPRHTPIHYRNPSPSNNDLPAPLRPKTPSQRPHIHLRIRKLLPNHHGLQRPHCVKTKHVPQNPSPTIPSRLVLLP
ncbi:MAG: hypothetical protein Q9197_007032 [Variospora fuerteventurae]